MTSARLARSFRRRLEPALALLVLTLTAVWVTEPTVDLVGSVAVSDLWVPATMIVPGLLAVSVLVRVVGHGTRLASRYVGSRNRVRRGDTTVSRIVASLVCGALGAFTL